VLNILNEASRCLLCKDGACTAVCPKGRDPARALRAVRFSNEACAARFIGGGCADCGGDCERACIHYDAPLRIRELAKELPKPPDAGAEVSLAIDFLGLTCENPFFLSSSVVASGYDMVARALEMGWAGAVYKTVGFIKPEEVSPRFDAIGKESAPFIGFKNLEQISDMPLEANLEILKKLKRNYPEKIIAASILGETAEEWARLAELATGAGVDFIECNFSCPHMSAEGLGSDVGQDPELVAEFTRAAKSGTHLPVIAKMTPNLGNIEAPAAAAVQAGADGLAAINTVKCLTGLDLAAMAPRMPVGDKSSVSGYSGKAVKPIALRFIHDMRVCAGTAQAPLSGMGGIETWRDALDFIALGCRNVQITTAVMQYGYRIIDDLILGLKNYMRENGVDALQSLVGRATDYIVSPSALDRATMAYPVVDEKKCIGCGRCEISCADGGHGAIAVKNGSAAVNGKKCAGCHLCGLVCPRGAISQSRRVQKRRRSAHGDHA
jgi:dihydropyrimidine dehydrogenase (NAD+) subunit PreA